MKKSHFSCKRDGQRYFKFDVEQDTLHIYRMKIKLLILSTVYIC
jgi:hypothetical protein